METKQLQQQIKMPHNNNKSHQQSLQDNIVKKQIKKPKGHGKGIKK